MWQLVKSAVYAVAILVLSMGVAQAQWGGGFGPGPGIRINGPATTQPEKPAPPVIWPEIAIAVDYPRVQTEALAKKLDVSYHRAYVSEVVADLAKRADARVAYSDSLGTGWTFTWDAKGVTVKDVLEKLAAEGKFDLSWQAALAVLTQKADDKALAALEKQLGDTDRWQRCLAVWGLGRLADVRIYPLLAKGLKDADAGVVEWSLKALELHSRMGCVMSEADRATVVQAVQTWLAAYLADDKQSAMGRLGWYGLPSRHPGWHLLRLELAGSTLRPDALKLLVDTITGEKVAFVSASSATALGINRIGATELLGALKKVNADCAQIQKEVDQLNEEFMKDRKPNDPIYLTGNSPREKAMAKLDNVLVIKQAIVEALLELRVPEVIQVVQSALEQPAPRGSEQSRLHVLALKYGNILNLQVNVQAQLKTLEAIYTAKEDPPAARGMGVFGEDDVPSWAYGATAAVQALADTSDPAVRAAFLKLVKNDKVYAGFSLLGQWVMQIYFPVTDPELVDALIARTTGGGAGAKVALRSLAQSHDPKVIAALINALKDADPQIAAEAGKALAKTRDPQALALLVALVQEKRDWPDVEAEDEAALKAGKGVRPRMNPRKVIIAAMLETRDPKAFTELLALAANRQLV